MRTEMENKALLAEYAEMAATCGSLRCITFSSPRSKEHEIRRIRGELRLIGGVRVLQLEYGLTEGRLRHENIPVEDGRVAARLLELTELGFARIELYVEGGTASLLVSKKGKETLLCPRSFDELVKGTGNVSEIRGNNREKNYMIPEDAPFLAILGISDKNGRVHDKRRAKFRQINRFAEYAVDQLRRVTDDEIRVADMCCGKSYLSFALYYAVTELLGKRCRMVCVDLKKSVIEDTAAAAKACGFDGMSFFCEDISNFSVDEPPHMVVSLHACDTATDIVLDFAIRSGALTVLSTPCCHRELSELFDCGELDFIAENSVLKQKLCSAATDALRLLRLRAAGYRADAVEFTDPEDTPKNVMLRACLLGDPDPSAAKRYNDAYRFLTGTDAPSIPEKQKDKFGR